MSCSTTVVKYLVFIFNLVFAIIGLAILIIGIIAKTQVAPSVSNHVSVDTSSILVIVVGAIVFVTAFFGCCGAIKESTCMLTAYATILLTLLIIQVAAGVFAFVQHASSEDVRELIKQSVQEDFNKYNVSSTDMDDIQSKIECCGVDGPSDYKWMHGKLPSSCCMLSVDGCSVDSSDEFTQGCADKIYQLTRDYQQGMAIAAVCVAAVEIIGAVFALCLASSIRNQIRRGAYA